MPGKNAMKSPIVGLVLRGVAAAEAAVDPILVASRFVVAVQEIVSREINPFDQAVITVGSFHGGLKHNSTRTA